MNKVYLAGPFFNDRQRVLMDQIELRLDEQKISYFSPRKVFNCPPDAPLEVRQATFKGNCKGIIEAECVLCVLDFLLPENRRLHLVEFTKESDKLVVAANVPKGAQLPEGIQPSRGKVEISLIGNPIVLPDVGTVWEMGFATALGKPVVGLKLMPDTAMNLMLAQACQNFITDADVFEAWAKEYGSTGVLPKGEQPWNGKII